MRMFKVVAPGNSNQWIPTIDEDRRRRGDFAGCGFSNDERCRVCGVISLREISPFRHHIFQPKAFYFLGMMSIGRARMV